MLSIDKELEDLLKRRDLIRDEFNKNEGAISFAQYLIKKETEEKEVKPES